MRVTAAHSDRRVGVAVVPLVLELGVVLQHGRALAGCVRPPASPCCARASTCLSSARPSPVCLQVGLGVGIGTYGGSVSLSVACDRALLGDAAREILGTMLEEHANYCTPGA